VGDSLKLTIYNTDSINHGIAIKGFAVNELIQAKDSIQINLLMDQAMTTFVHDPTNDGAYRNMGLASILYVADPASNHTSFFWNMKDHQAEFNSILASGGQVDWQAYNPDYFTINGRSNPMINRDSSARVRGKVGDTLLIHMVNTGHSIHSIHFHGYHCEIVSSSKEKSHVGRKKDTFPIYGGEVVVLRLIPDQPGEFPVHDHNLVAVTGGGIYPNGMFLTLLIEE
jgi:FtsP/CotA-like multicopper oxidase with cupredoxin domain